VIKREYFLVKDARPLYHWPEKDIAPTTHDNWEPQFKPKVVERPKSAIPVVVVQEVSAPTEAQQDEDDGEEGEEDSVNVAGGEVVTGDGAGAAGAVGTLLDGGQDQMTNEGVPTEGQYDGEDGELEGASPE
jgi:hypothetical protein